MEPKLNKDVLPIWKHYVIERNNIYKKKEIEKLTSPWTDDKILQEFRFTNVKRWQDRESRWLIENIVKNPKLSYRDKVLNCILFRTWNKGKTFDIICGKGITVDELLETSNEVFRQRILDYSSEDFEYVWYTNAFNCGGIKQSWKYPDLITNGGTYHYTQKRETREEYPEYKIEECIPLRMIYLAKHVVESGLLDGIVLSNNSREVFETLKTIHGIAGFLAYQIYIDITYISDSPFTEDDLVDAGPGCRRGLDYLFESKEGASYEELIFWLWRNQNEIFSDYNLEKEFNYPLYYKGNYVLSIQDLENIECEFSKYYKAYTESGRPKNKFKSQSLVQSKLF